MALPFAGLSRVLDGLSALPLMGIGPIELLRLLSGRGSGVAGLLDHAIR